MGIFEQIACGSLQGAKDLPCVQAAAFSGSADGSITYISLNRCDRAVQTSWPLPVAQAQSGSIAVSQTIYSALPGNAGGFVPLSAIQSVQTPPWRNGPLSPTSSASVLGRGATGGGVADLQSPPLSLSFIHVAAAASVL